MEMLGKMLVIHFMDVLKSKRRMKRRRSGMLGEPNGKQRDGFIILFLDL